jgi:hypothetical protein
MGEAAKPAVVGLPDAPIPALVEAPQRLRHCEHQNNCDEAAEPKADRLAKFAML